MRSSCCLVVLCLTLFACGRSVESSCLELREPEDPGSGQHVLTEGAVVYRTHPPTSGPHVAGPAPEGVLADPLPAPIQVRLLEAGGVLIQYDASLSAPEVTELTDMASSSLVVAPGLEALPDRIVATAWTWKLSCGSVEPARLAMFAEQRSGDAPGLD